MRVHRVPPGTMHQRSTTERPNACDAIAVQRANIPLNAPLRFNAGARRARSTGGNAFIYTHAQVHGFRYPQSWRSQ